MTKIYLSFLFIAICILFLQINADTKFTTEILDVYESSFPEDNILPCFKFSQGSVEGGGTQFVLNPHGGTGQKKPSSFDDSLPDKYLEGLMTDVRSPILPYTLQSHWNCDAATSIKKREGLILESDAIKVTITPEVNGKIWAMHDKINDRPMVQSKIGPNHQRNFANIAVAKRWGSGGVEYNWSQYIGHSHFAERETYAAKFDTPKGPVIRVWEFDRFNHSTWQVDVLVENDVVWMHPRVVNFCDNELPAYWWTCVAHTVKGSDRFVSPAQHTGQTEAGPTRYSTWPHFAGVLNSTFQNGDGVWQIDHSFQENIIWGDFFVDVPDELDKWIQLTAEDGYSIYHGHENDGTKVFTWGNNGNSRFMQRFLANFPEDQDSGNYVELQTGLMKTQSQLAKVPKKSVNGGVREWTEFFMAWKPKNDQELHALRGEIYQNAVNLTQDRAVEMVSHQKRKEMDDFFKSISAREIKQDEILNYGAQWGPLHNKLLKKLGREQIPLSTPFSYQDGRPNHDTKPWDDLIELGTFSPETLLAIPSSWQISEEWRVLLEESVEKYGANWLNLYHLATIDMEYGGVDYAKLLLKQSIALKPTPHAYRSLALLSANEQDALPVLMKAWDLALAIPTTTKNRDRLVYYLGSEIASFLQQSALRGLPNFRRELKTFIEEEVTKLQVPKDLLTTDQVISAQVALALWYGNPQTAIDILADDSKNCFPTYGRQRSELIDYWHQAHYAIESQKVGRELSPLEQRNIRMTKVQPRRIGCPYASWYCHGYW